MTIRCTCRPRWLNPLRVRIRKTARGWSATYLGLGSSLSVEVWDEPHALREAIEALHHSRHVRVEVDESGDWREIGQSVTCPRGGAA